MIKVSDLVKIFPPIKAVNGISFQINKGEIVGLLGPNGAGKSTTVRMITGFITPTSGTIEVQNLRYPEKILEAQKKIGYVSENAALYGDLSVYDFLHFVAELRMLPCERIEEEIARVSKICVLNKVQEQKIETLSKGFKRRVSLAQALIHDPDILILDEPTDGLDPNQKHDVRLMIKSLAENKCVIISTHILEEVEALCSRVMIIAEGSIVFDGATANFKAKSNIGKLDDVFRAMTTHAEVEGVCL
ncbi:MAG: ABC transporter ATP-binding protein [Oligoflexia bacterium]|nr:ABC transporter ATP-binding protein [Oligoflexia bacterium]MBF0364025.1 ABC transporter ATP-binding protein [Oligoflexia bacterium]